MCVYVSFFPLPSRGSSTSLAFSFFAKEKEAGEEEKRHERLGLLSFSICKGSRFFRWMKLLVGIQFVRACALSLTGRSDTLSN